MNYKAQKVNGKKVDTHRYIMEEYLGRKLSKDEVVHHIDGNKRNNSIENLEVLTRAEHSRIHTKGRAVSEETKNKIKEALTGRPNLVDSKRVYQYDLENNFIRDFPSAREAARYLGNVTRSVHISEVCRCQRKSAYGYIWKY